MRSPKPNRSSRFPRQQQAGAIRGQATRQRVWARLSHSLRAWGATAGIASGLLEHLLFGLECVDSVGLRVPPYRLGSGEKLLVELVLYEKVHDLVGAVCDAD